jgi:hypothetical protein
MLLAVGAVAQAAVIDEVDWTLRDPTKAPNNWQLNGTAQLAIPSYTPGQPPAAVLQLTQNGNFMAGTAWHKLKSKPASFTFIADIRARNASGCPADGFTMAFANTTETAVGGLGGNLGLFGAETLIPEATAMEVNTCFCQGLGDGDCETDTAVSETVAFDIANASAGHFRATGQNQPGDAQAGGFKMGQAALPAGMKIVNGGFYRYQWNVDGATNTMTLFITGLEEGNKQFQKAKVLEQKIGVPVLNFEGRLGLTAATGGLNHTVEVTYTKIEVPMTGPQ